MEETILRLCSLFGPSGYEDEVRAFLRAQAEPYADKLLQDNNGSLLVLKKGRTETRQTVLLSAHMDEVGVIIRDVNERGFLKFAFIGDIDRRAAIGKQVWLGPERVPGVIGMKPIHLTTKDERSAVPKTKELYIDVGARTRQEAETLARPGTWGCFASQPEPFGAGKLRAKALDSRIGCAVLLELLKQELPVDTWFAFTVQQKVGCRGAYPAAFRLKPDAALALAAAPALDFPPHEGGARVCALGKGPVIPVMDKGTIYDPKLTKLLQTCAKDRDLPWQPMTALTSRTDASAIQRSLGGCMSAALLVPVRYLDSPSGVADPGDIRAMLEITQTFLEKLEEIYG